MKIAREKLAVEYLSDALIILMKKMDYKDISITKICEKAGVTRMSFYRNYSSKEDVLKSWIKAITNSFLEETKISYKGDSSEEYFQKLFSHFKKYANICQLIYKAGLIYLIKDEFDRVFLELHKEEYDEYKSYFLAGGVYNIFLLWLIHGCKESPEELSSRLENLLVT
ncbi:TetR/AcrR family transcriptional regulator [Lachnospira pectinoschiza]|uniref:Transcriptional regulator, TetR family n=1 Tax=Lachnospira pectinoschiza TaxID=28052 RepID=A0A1G9Y7R9_9FIRM|nr:TetR/AcrR family transcriptional regulator [Lachnospira pectinoschiza]SDN05149.1 transcriptional regulator, TetR family [Lachnospira pectinoschiza]